MRHGVVAWYSIGDQPCVYIIPPSGAFGINIAINRFWKFDGLPCLNQIRGAGLEGLIQIMAKHSDFLPQLFDTLAWPRQRCAANTVRIFCDRHVGACRLKLTRKSLKLTGFDHCLHLLNRKRTSLSHRLCLLIEKLLNCSRTGGVQKRRATGIARHPTKRLVEKHKSPRGYFEKIFSEDSFSGNLPTGRQALVPGVCMVSPPTSGEKLRGRRGANPRWGIRTCFKKPSRSSSSPITSCASTCFIVSRITETAIKSEVQPSWNAEIPERF